VNNFITRTLTGIVFVLVLAGSILFFPPIAFGIITFFLIVLGLNEFYRLTKTENYYPNRILGILLGVALFCGVFFTSLGWLQNPKVFWLLLPIAWIVLIAELYRKKEKPFQNIALTLLGVIYIALPFSLLYLMGFTDFPANGYKPKIILGFFFLLWTSDTGAYLFGMTLGRHPFFPRISPKKSWEGFIGGVICTLLISLIISHYFTVLSSVQWLVVAAIIAIFGAIGDLIESLLKRSLNVKDSGNILPGHGGILDRFDSVIFSAPLVFIYLQF
jgi:phosphatidate cytidylyltransferase